MLLRRLLLCSLAACLPAVLIAQIPSRNINMVTGRTLPDGDPFLQRQNEPSIAASTRNPLHLLAGANDYRTVDLPGLPGSEETGDAWMGLFKSFDGGVTWRSTLVPGYPQDQSDAGRASPLKGYEAAADPVVRAGTNGLFYYSGIVFDRGTPGKSAMFVARFIDNNNKETGDSIVYLGTSLVASNPGTALIDKPWLVTDIPRAGAQTCTVTTTQPNPTVEHPDATVTTTQSFPGGASYVVFSQITGEGTAVRSQIYFARSLDCARTWSTPQQVSSSDDPINQGATLAVDPRDGAVYLAWRRFAADGTDDSIVVTRSRTQGRKWDPPGRARRFPRGKKVGLQPGTWTRHFLAPFGMTDLTSLDQPTDENRFRSNAYPTMTVDETGRVYVAWSERGFAPIRPSPVDGDARIMIATSANGLTWTEPRPVDDSMLSGHQIMPSIAYAGGKLMVAYYDFRRDASQLFEKWIHEQSAIFTSGRRHTVDVRAVQGTPGRDPVFGASVQVSEYLWGLRPGRNAIEQLQYNPPNLKLFKGGKVPFFGDYIDLAPSPPFVPVIGGWAYNTALSSSPLFHAAWTDNRDVVPPFDGNWESYTPPADTGSSNVCEPGREGMRNQNIYTARITGGLVAGSPGNNKPLDPAMPRAFVVFVQNATSVLKAFRLTIENQPPGGRASFSQYPLPPYSASSGPPVLSLEAVVPPRSTVARTVFVTSSDPRAQVHVAVKEIASLEGPLVPQGLEAAIVLNPDSFAPDISNPDLENFLPDISNPDIWGGESYYPDISNPDISNPDISNLLLTPDISNPDIASMVLVPDISNPNYQNAAMVPDISNPDISNPDIANLTPDISNQSLTDTTWTVTNTGNTAAAYTVKLLVEDPALMPDPSKILLQLILRKVVTYPAAYECQLGQAAQNVLLANVVHPQFASFADPVVPDISNPDIANATLWLAPGESARVTLRTFDTDIHDTVTFDAASEVTPAIVAQGVNTEDMNDPGASPPIARPDMALVRFINLALTGTTTVPLPPFGVQLTDNTAAPLAGVSVSVSLRPYPEPVVCPGCPAPVYAVFTAITNAAGVAQFALPFLIEQGTYRVRATAAVAPYPPVEAYSRVITISAPVPITVTVNTTADSGPGSLRQAILETNANGPVADRIVFAIPGVAPFTIAPQSPLPAILDAVEIDGTSQPGFGGSPVIMLDGAAAGAAADGLSVRAPHSAIRGLAIGHFQGTGIQLEPAAVNTRIQSNYIGLSTDGTTAAPNLAGVQSQANGAVIDTNVISGNTQWGCVIHWAAGVDDSGTVIRGNYIGTNASGTAAVPNHGGGVRLTVAATVGGPGPGDRNVISGNNGAGISLTGDDHASPIQGNFIGTNAAGDAAIPNQGPGITITDTEDSIIGGAGGARNLISGNTGHGIELLGDASATAVVNNYIGVNLAGSATIPNGGAGVSIVDTFSVTLEGNIISGNGGDGIRTFNAAGTRILGNYIGTGPGSNGAFGNTGAGIMQQEGTGDSLVGNDAAGLQSGALGTANVIAYNVRAGIFGVQRADGVFGNRIYSNTGLGIDIGVDGVTANDAAEDDGIQNYPVVTLAQVSAPPLAAGTILVGSLKSTPATEFEIRFFFSNQCDASGHGEGMNQLIATRVMTDVAGDASFALLAPTVQVGHWISATARRLDTNSTSEFSSCVAVGVGGGGGGGVAQDSALVQPPAGVRDESLFVAGRLD